MYKTISDRPTRLCIAFTLLAFVLFFSPAVGAQENKVEHETGFYYTIQKGDTLWDLSERFADSPWQWPDLWQKNKQIANPHWIYPGERIRLYRKEGYRDLTPPPPPPQEPVPEKEKPYFYYSAIDSLSFIKTKPDKPLGKIIKSRDNKQLLAVGDPVYIQRYGDSSFIRGGKYTCYRLVDPMRNYDIENRYGVQYYPTGIVEITAEEDGFLLGQIVASFREMQIGNLLMPYRRQERKIILEEAPVNVKGKVIGGEEGQNLLGDNTTAFIDKGTRDGIKPGQMFTMVYREMEQLNPKKRAYTLLPPVNFGSFIVLHTEAKNSTVFILKSSKAVKPGTDFRSMQ